jgi:hypothetical protein
VQYDGSGVMTKVTTKGAAEWFSINRNADLGEETFPSRDSLPDGEQDRLQRKVTPPRSKRGHP